MISTYQIYFHHGMVEENFAMSMASNAPEWRISTYFKILSPWLKNILEFQWSHIIQNEGFQFISSKYFHHGWRKFWNFNGQNEGFHHISKYFHHGWKKKLEFQWSQMLQNEGFQLISKYFHLGWRKFRNFNAAEWKISIYFIKIFSQWLKKILEFRYSKILQNEGFQHI